MSRARSPSGSASCSRSFPLALDLGAYHGLLGQEVAELPSVGAMIYAESAYALAALCPRPSLVCDEDLLPFKEASLNLIVSGLALHRVNDLPGALVQIRRALCPDGLFIGGLLGARSLIELRQALIEAEAESEGGASPRVAPFGDVQRLWRAAAAGGLCAAGRRRRSAEGALRLAPRVDARDPRAGRRQCACASGSKAPLSRRTLDRAEAIYRERHATPDGRR